MLLNRERAEGIMRERGLDALIATEPPGRRYSTLAWLALAGLIVARQWLATRETREEVEAGRDAVLASVSHDLRTPLTAVRGYSQILAEQWDRHSAEEPVRGRAETL